MPQATDLHLFVCPVDLILYMQTANDRSVKYGLESTHISWHESQIPVPKYIQVRKNLRQCRLYLIEASETTIKLSVSYP